MKLIVKQNKTQFGKKTITKKRRTRAPRRPEDHTIMDEMTGTK